MQRAILCAALLAGCVPAGPADPVEQVGGDAALLEIGPAPGCDEPVPGFDRFTEESEARGLTPPNSYEFGLTPCVEFLGALSSSDLEGDGDLDLLFHNRDGFPFVYVNDGAGSFSAVHIARDVRGTYERSVLAHGAVDLDGDGLPEVIVTGASLVLVAWNLGDLRWSEFEALVDDPSYPRACINTMSWGDVDGDGDLDLLFPTTEPVLDADQLVAPGDEASDPPPPLAMPDRLMFNDDGAFERVVTLVRSGGDAGYSLLGAFTDRDVDGDLDVLIAAERVALGWPPTAFFRNDGPDADKMLVDDAPLIGADLELDGMGFASADFDFDGLPDYCMTSNTPRLRCLRNDGAGRYVETSNALGLIAQTPLDGVDNPGEVIWWPWSLELVDLDNDGHLDAAATAGGPYEWEREMPDAIWQGTPDDTFVDRTGDLGFGDVAHHFGMAADDFDGDGHRDLVMRGITDGAKFWSNPCGSGGWIEVDLRGADMNVEGFGARIEATFGGRTRMAEVHGVRSLGQGSSSVHFGLGAAEVVDALTVWWPDGEVTELTNVPGSRHLLVKHPDSRP